MTFVRDKSASLPSTRDGSSESAGSVLVVDDHPRARESIADALMACGFDVDCSASGQEALQTISQHVPDVIVSDLQMPGMSGIELIRELERRNVDSQIVIVTAHATVSSAVQAMRYGAFDYIEKPFNAEQLEALVHNAMKQASGEPRRSSVPKWAGKHAAMIGDSAPMRRLRCEIERCAATNVTVLISGESGTGKELVARSLHLESHRADAAFVSLNCPAMSPQLMESELFGHQQGAFTGADGPRVGRFELADGGTILLDEITEIDLALQAKLLRVLQERSFERVGSSATQKADVRVLATTNRDLATEVQQGRFREDLYFRLAVVPVRVPPLRQRRDDISLLADHFSSVSADRLQRPAAQLTTCAYQCLAEYRWPGNVRELENLITRASVLGQGQPLTADDLHAWLMDDDVPNERRDPVAVGQSLQEMERALIETTLDHFGGHREQTAKALGIGIRTLANKLKSYGYAPRATFSKSA